MNSDEIRAEQERIKKMLGGKTRGGRASDDRGRYGNKLQAAYAEHLTALQYAGDIRWWAFQPLRFKLRLAKDCFYSPDFAVLRPDDPTLEIHETKGHMEDDAAVKLRIVAEHFWMFRLFIVRLVRGQWEEEERA